MYQGKLHCSLVITLVISSLSRCDETTQQYLENAVRSLKNLRQLQTFKRVDIPEDNLKPFENLNNRRSQPQYSEGVPPLSLTKGELAALYEQAVSKGESLKLDTGDSEYVHAVVHHLDEDKPADSHVTFPKEHEVTEHEAPSEDAGYYYYYYPLKSFMDEFTSQPSDESPHNVTIQAADHHKKEAAKPMEPLFMAISGFIGMAVMFVLSMMFFPKYKPKIFNDIKKKDKLDDFARFALNAIEGHCAERFACELTKTARSFDVEDNRFYKLLKRVAPGTFGRYINNSQKYANKQLQCTAIPCQKKKPNNQNKKPINQNQKKKNINNKSANKKSR
ncbi:uncharacterized protein LOC126748692 isoform X2 [Anthonomus grandis grandis]|uniref:uncharacterized protein LOC126748692 isoform X2 n=1 Tax=Anthonomus grandis grandis TaxID=2921223 RepID=UPI002165A6A8|nr:uncharacterized protein LOC126748692 isoform X2 [Anthonomus grandis grandis]